MTLDMQVSGLLTLVLSAAAASAAFVGWWLLSQSEARVGKKMAAYLVVHAALFVVTMGFGAAGLLGAPHWLWHTIYHVRVAVLFLELVFLVSLVKTFYEIYQTPE